MDRRRHLTVAALVALALAVTGRPAPAAAQDPYQGWITPAPATTPAPAPSPSAAAPSAPARPPAIDVRLGIAGGGAPLLGELSGPVATTTARMTVAALVRLRVPRVSWRILEVYAVWPHGVGITLQNEDLRLGAVRLHLLDVGLFYASAAPVTVQRLERRWDLTLGAGMEIDLPSRLSLTADVRLFAPLDVFGVVTQHGDAARLVGEEIARGAQLWTGISYRW